ncbi:hypothetical protein [Burkholderia dolosa]|uniref:hypothetical protein n=1 Tax=Burkholderia dolosa TaxID=152500 RepID=UPI001C97097F|nr:hypothetical protein [Burkholderia dolosa]MBY4751846.1 hypothetical protein [Burkholderia dolosa]
MEVKAAMTERSFNLVVPLAHKATAMRTTDTSRRRAARSGAVSPLIGEGLQQSDVDSTITPVTPGIRTSTTATRTTTTRAPRSARAPSADWNAHAGVNFTELVEAYLDCRRTKRNTATALAFEANLERNLRDLYDEPTVYRIGKKTAGRHLDGRTHDEFPEAR